jgi:hypothetical protein
VLGSCEHHDEPLGLVKTTPHATGGNNKQGANYRLQEKQNIGLTNIKSKLLQQTPGNKKQFETNGRRPL